MYTKTTAAFLLAAACTADSALAFAPSDAGALARSQAGLQCQAKSSRPSTTVSGALPLAPSKASGVTALSMQAWGQAEDAAAVLARVAQAESGGSASYSAPAAPSYSAPAPAQSSNDVADVLARVAAMNGGAAPATSAPAPVSAPAAQGEDVNAILARVASMNSGSPSNGASAPSYSAPAAAAPQQDSAADVLQRLSQMGGASGYIPKAPQEMDGEFRNWKTPATGNWGNTWSSAASTNYVPATSAPPPSAPASNGYSAAPSGNVDDVMARLRAMEQGGGAAPAAPSYSAPAPAAAPSGNVDDVMARLRAMEQGGSAAPATASYSAPAPAAPQQDSAADVLARVAAMSR
uniref:Uncharacterized protein n=2 Tax=Hemiselmis andersenii TaxID=464988 RepID=A0A6T8MF20_HEMAN|mmetsp:Transcript_20384/g.47081  ORF Transcript_20384/g.47081 Transcript_20384/m.47081 type:complete len:349 (+) Transcript_20384:68-1114(+)